MRRAYLKALALYKHYLELFPDRYLLVEPKLSIIEAKTGKKIDELVCLASSAHTVSVVVFGSLDYDQTHRCIESVLLSENKTNYRLLVINDLSSEESLASYLSELSSNGRIQLIENSQRNGFVRSVNTAMAAFEAEDVIILASCTEVPNQWIDKLRKQAYCNSTVGTVTPFSNDAEICSFPEICSRNALEDWLNLDEYQTFFEENQKHGYVELPTAAGYCIYLKRSMLESTGYFDEKHCNGETAVVDLSLKAKSLGWIHHCCTDLYVSCHPFVPCRENSGDEPSGFAAARIEGDPEYAHQISEFRSKDPLRMIRNAISQSMLSELIARKNYVKKFIFCSHSMGGGTQVCMDEISARLDNENCLAIHLYQPAGHLNVKVYNHSISFVVRLSDEWNDFLSFLQTLEIDSVQFHHLLGLSENVLSLPPLLRCPYDVTLHDYYAICPRINVISGDQYCGDEISIQKCRACLSSFGPHQEVERFDGNDIDIESWIRNSSNFLKESRKIYVPSSDMFDRLTDYFPDLALHLRPHPEPYNKVKLKRSNHGLINVCFIGAIDPLKGLNHIKGCLAHALAQSMPIHFWVIGTTSEDEEVGRFSNCSITGRYDRAELPKLIDESESTIAMLLSICPETYSYTLSEALQNGLNVITFDIGAIQERLPANAGKVLPLDSSPETICNSVIELSKNSEESYVETGNEYASIVRDYY